MGGGVKVVQGDHLALHGLGEQFFKAALAGAQAGGAALAAQRGDDDGAGEDRGQGFVGIRGGNEVSALDADGGHRGVEPEALTRGLAPGTGDGAHHADIEPELDGIELGLLLGVGVVFYEQAAGGAHAEARAINKPQVHVAAGVGFNAVALAHKGATGHRARHTVCRGNMGHADDERGLAHDGGRSHCGRATDHGAQGKGRQKQPGRVELVHGGFLWQGVQLQKDILSR